MDLKGRYKPVLKELINPEVKMDPSNPLVSVIIPTYNRAYCIRTTIDSVLKQSYERTEILVIDDGSTDNTMELICLNYGAEKRVKYIRQENGGVSAARNHGINVAQGDFVAFLDSDDLWKPWKLQMQLSCLKALPDVGMIWTDMETIDLNGRIVTPKYLTKMYSAYRWFTTEDLFSDSIPLSQVVPAMDSVTFGRTLFSGDIFSQMVMGNLVHTSTVLLSRERLHKVGGFNETLYYSGEDYDFHLRTCREGPVAFIDVSSIQYRIGLADQLTRPEYSLYMATNFLKTLLHTIAQDRDRIRLPNNMIKYVLSEAYGWAGEEYLNYGKRKQGKLHLKKSLRYRFLQPKLMMLYVISLLPTSAGESVRKLPSAIKKIKPRLRKRE